MIAELSEQERTLLIQVLSDELEELGPEIHHTDNREYRQGLRDRRAVLRSALDKLQKTVQPVG
jgi:hypothetical protein